MYDFSLGLGFCVSVRVIIGIIRLSVASCGVMSIVRVIIGGLLADSTHPFLYHFRVIVIVIVRVRVRVSGRERLRVRVS